MELDVAVEDAVEGDLHRVGARGVQREVEGGDEGEVHLGHARGWRADVQLAVGRPELVARGVEPGERDDVGAYVVQVALEAHHEVRARVHGGESAYLHGVENAEHIELPLLGEVGGVGEEREGDVHRRKLSAGDGGGPG
jgi:hypothetical protein